MANVRPQKLNERKTAFASIVADGQSWGGTGNAIFSRILSLWNATGANKVSSKLFIRRGLKLCNTLITCQNRVVLTVR